MQLDDERGPRRPRPGRIPGSRSAPRVPAPTDLPVIVEDLRVYELNGDGHTIARHCDPTPGADAARLATHPWLPATGSFLGVATAQRAVEACVDANRDEVIAWREGDGGRWVLTHETGAVIGDVLRRAQWVAGDTTPRPATRVLVVLRRNPAYRSGFAVRTAYPIPSVADRTIRPVRIPVEEATP